MYFIFVNFYKVGNKILGNVKPEEWDLFHELILHEERILHFK